MLSFLHFDRQFRRPSGLLGRIIARRMRWGNRPEFTRLINGFDITDQDRLLEIGFGPGDSFKLIEGKNDKCQITGIDFSMLMVKQASRRNKSLIKAKRLELHLGDFRTFDFKDQRFNKIYCVNVVYFWEELESGFRKTYELLENGGVFGIFMVSNEHIESSAVVNTSVFNRHPISHVKECLEQAGFKEISISIYESGGSDGYYIYAFKK
jgi:ubiquinone/menaquinone biosynthesis C-methylase UbiE